MSTCGNWYYSAHYIQDFLEHVWPLCRWASFIEALRESVLVAGFSRDTGHWGSSAVMAQTQWTYVQTLTLREQRDLTLYTLTSRLQKQGARFNPHMITCNYIGYYTPQCYVTFFMFRYFKFYLPAMPSPPPCYIIRTQTCLLLYGPPPCYSIPPFMLGLT
jgi:hypothetical protein